MQFHGWELKMLQKIWVKRTYAERSGLVVTTGYWSWRRRTTHMHQVVWWGNKYSISQSFTHGMEREQASIKMGTFPKVLVYK